MRIASQMAPSIHNDAFPTGVGQPFRRDKSGKSGADDQEIS